MGKEEDECQYIYSVYNLKFAFGRGTIYGLSERERLEALSSADVLRTCIKRMQA